MYAKTITAATGNVTPYIVAAGFYLIVTIPMTKFINSMESRMADGRRSKHKKADEDPDETKNAPLDPGSASAAHGSLSDTEADAAAQIKKNAQMSGNHISH